MRNVKSRGVEGFDVTKTIPLTQGYETIVDDEDYEFLVQWQWHVCFSSSGNVYAMRNSEPVNGRRHHILMHRVLNGTPKGLRTDHRDGNGLNNSRDNLRDATPVQNGQNRRPNKVGTSKYKGVFWHKQHRKWYAKIQVNKKPITIGLFRDEKEAADAYAARAAIEFSDFNKEVYYE